MRARAHRAFKECAYLLFYCPRAQIYLMFVSYVYSLLSADNMYNRHYKYTYCTCQPKKCCRDNKVLHKFITFTRTSCVIFYYFTNMRRNFVLNLDRRPKKIFTLDLSQFSQFSSQNSSTSSPSKKTSSPQTLSVFLNLKTLSYKSSPDFLVAS